MVAALKAVIHGGDSPEVAAKLLTDRDPQPVEPTRSERDPRKEEGFDDKGTAERRSCDLPRNRRRHLSTKAVILASDGTVSPGPGFRTWRGSRGRAGRPVGLANQHHRSGPRAGPAHRDRPRCRNGHALPHRLAARRHRRAVDRGDHLGSPRVGRAHRAAHRRVEPAHRRLLGNHLMPATAMGAAHRLLQTIEPEAAAAASTFGLAGTWLGQWLTGERAIDPTQASYTGLMASTDGSCRWLVDVLHRLGIPPEQLPPVRPSLSVLGPLQGTAAATLGLPQGSGHGRIRRHTRGLLRAGHRAGGRPLLIMGTRTWCPMPWPFPIPSQGAAAGRRPRGPVADQRRHQRRRCAGRGCRAARLRAGRHRGGSPGRHRIPDPARPDGGRAGVHPAHPARTRPLWFAEPRTALLGAIPDPAAPQPPAESSKACCSPTG